MSWVKNKNHCHFELLSFLTLHNNEPSLGLWCGTKSGLYTTTCDCLVIGLWRNSKACPRAKLTPSESWFGGLLFIWSRFLNSTQHYWTRIFISVSVRCTENGTMQPALSTGRAESSPWQCPGGCTLHSQHFRRQMNWAMKKSLSTIFTWLLSNQLLLNHLCNCLQDKYFCSWEGAGSTSNSPSNLEVQIQFFFKLHFLLWVVCMGVTCVVLLT